MYEARGVFSKISTNIPYHSPPGKPDFETHSFMSGCRSFMIKTTVLDMNCIVNKEII